MPRANSKKCIY